MACVPCHEKLALPFLKGLLQKRYVMSVTAWLSRSAIKGLYWRLASKLGWDDVRVLVSALHNTKGYLALHNTCNCLGIIIYWLHIPRGNRQAVAFWRNLADLG